MRLDFPGLISIEAVGLSQLGLLGLGDAGKRIGELSVGQQRRLDLAKVIAERPHVLLLDEPTNHLSITLVDELTESINATRAAVVISTHDRKLLEDLSTWSVLIWAVEFGSSQVGHRDTVATWSSPSRLSGTLRPQSMLRSRNRQR